MKLKRFFATVTLAALCLTSFAACSKKETENPDTTPDTTPTGSIEISSDDLINATPSPDTIILGGYFERDNINISIYYTDTWHINGLHYTTNPTSYQLLAGPLSHKDGAELLYTDDNNELSFVFTSKALTVKVNKGTDYTIFEGTYDRVEQSISTTETISPKEGSVLELIGNIAVTHYMLQAEGMLDCMVQPAEITVDNKLMIEYILAYTDLFLVAKAEFVEEISDRYLCYAFTEEKLNDVLMAASNDRFGVKDLDITGTDIVLKDAMYYVPCYGNYAGGVLTRYTAEAPENIPEQLILDGAVTKKDHTSYRMEMTISTSSENPSEVLGVKIDSIRYKVTK